MKVFATKTCSENLSVQHKYMFKSGSHSLWGDKRVLEIDRGNDCPVTELCTLKWLKWQIVLFILPRFTNLKKKKKEEELFQKLRRLPLRAFHPGVDSVHVSLHW